MEKDQGSISNSENPSSSLESEQKNAAILLPKNVLITGGCGFIGSNFINYIFDNWPLARFLLFYFSTLIFLLFYT